MSTLYSANVCFPVGSSKTDSSKIFDSLDAAIAYCQSFADASRTVVYYDCDIDVVAYADGVQYPVGD